MLSVATTVGREKNTMLCEDYHIFSCFKPVIHSDVAEQVGHGLSVVDAADGLWQDHANVDCFDLWTLELLELVGDRVGHHHLAEEKTEREREMRRRARVCMAFSSGRWELEESSGVLGWSTCVIMTIISAIWSTLLSCFTVCFLFKIFFFLNLLNIKLRFLSLIPCMNDEPNNDTDPLSRL